MPVEIIHRIRDMGIFYSEGWSMSETTCAGTQNPLLGRSKIGSIGIPVINTDVRLVDLEEGREAVSQGEPGEMVIKGPTVTQGYWNNPEETALQIRNGWLHTGDIAIQDEDGFFFIIDRKKDMIIAGGFNIYPREIDEVLHQHPKIQSAIAVGFPMIIGERRSRPSCSEERRDATAREIWPSAGRDWRDKGAKGGGVPAVSAPVGSRQGPPPDASGRGGP
jgi:acyl-CoA synthetase (AMP-forming)/AMP-acid ligase II